MKYLAQVAVLVLASLIVFGIVYTPVASFIPGILILLVLISIIYALIMKRKRRGQEIFVGSNKEVIMIIAFVLLIVFLTGGIRSPIFFLTYFVFFGLAFIFEPVMIFFFLVCLVGVFLPQAVQDDLFGNSLKLLSLGFLAPIAYFFGREYKRREKLAEKVKASTDTIIGEAKEIIQTKDKNERLKKAEEIIEDARALQKETKN